MCRNAQVLAFLILGIVLLWIMSFTGPVVSLSAGAAVGGIIVTASWMLFQEKTIMYTPNLPKTEILGGL